MGARSLIVLSLMAIATTEASHSYYDHRRTYREYGSGPPPSPSPPPMVEVPSCCDLAWRDECRINCGPSSDCTKCHEQNPAHTGNCSRDAYDLYSSYTNECEICRESYTCSVMCFQRCGTQWESACPGMYLPYWEYRNGTGDICAPPPVEVGIFVGVTAGLGGGLILLGVCMVVLAVKVCAPSGVASAITRRAERRASERSFTRRVKLAMRNPSTNPTQGRFDPNTGQPIPQFDPNTGQQNWGQVESGTAAVPAMAAAAAAQAAVAATVAPQVPVELKVGFASNAPLGIGLTQLGDVVVVSSVGASSAAAEVPTGATIKKINEVSCAGKNKDQVIQQLKYAKSVGPVVVTFEIASVAI